MLAKIQQEILKSHIHPLPSAHNRFGWYLTTWRKLVNSSRATLLPPAAPSSLWWLGLASDLQDGPLHELCQPKAAARGQINPYIESSILMTVYFSTHDEFSLYACVIASALQLFIVIMPCLIDTSPESFCIRSSSCSTSIRLWGVLQRRWRAGLFQLPCNAHFVQAFKSPRWMSKTCCICITETCIRNIVKCDAYIPNIQKIHDRQIKTT